MSKPPKPFTTPRRKDTGTFQVTLNVSCGLPLRVCREWQRQSFQKFPDAISHHRNPKTKVAAETGAIALIQYLRHQLDAATAPRIITDEITVGAWLEKFTAIDTSPRTARNAAKNRPYSPDTLENYRGYWNAHIKDDPLTGIRMADLEEQDILEFSARMSLRKKKAKGGGTLGGTRTFAGIVGFVRMAFTEYQRTHPRWYNPFTGIDRPQVPKSKTDALTEDEVVRLFQSGALKDTMELAVCAAMFLAGLRRSEIIGLKPENLDWETPKIVVSNAWQRVDRKNRVYGPTKGKKVREAPFDPVLQEAIKKLWEKNGQHEYVFAKKGGGLLGSTWIYVHFKTWVKAAGINTAGRKIVPHSARHSLASLLETRGISMRYIQELLGHSDLKTTMSYLHSTDATIRTVGQRIAEVLERDEKVIQFKIS